MSSDVKLQKQLRYKIGMISVKLNLNEIILFHKIKSHPIDQFELDVIRCRIERAF